MYHTRYYGRFLSLLGLVCLLLFSGCTQDKYQRLYHALPINMDGNPAGQTVLVVFLDYSDVNSLKMGPILNELMEKSPNLRVIYRPMVMHPKQAYASKMVLAAGLQDRFLAAHHLAINAHPGLSEAALRDLVSQAFVDPKRLQQDLNSPEVMAALEENKHLAVLWQVNTVPAFLIGRLNQAPVLLVGPQSLKTLMTAVNKESAT